MIVERCKKIREAVDKAKRLQSMATEKEAYQTRRNQLVNLTSTSEAISSAIILARQEVIGDVNCSQRISDIKTEVDELKNSFLSKPSSILPPKTLKKLEELISSFTQDATNQLQDSWTKFKSKNLIAINEELLSVLERIPGFRPQVQNVRANNQAIRTTYQNFPRTKAQITGFLELTNELKTGWTKLDSTNLPPAVMDFLQEAVSYGGASISKLTPEVVNWLRTYQVESSFKIKLNA